MTAWVAYAAALAGFVWLARYCYLRANEGQP